LDFLCHPDRDTDEYAPVLPEWDLEDFSDQHARPSCHDKTD
jgi:hypothetical protein